MGIFDKFKKGFQKSASAFSSGLKEVIIKKEIDDENLNKIEEFLIQSDVGIEAASEIKKISNKLKSALAIKQCRRWSLLNLAACVRLPLREGTMQELCLHSPFSRTHRCWKTTEGAFQLYSIVQGSFSRLPASKKWRGGQILPPPCIPSLIRCTTG